MEHLKKIVLILNPISGGKNKLRILKEFNRFDKALAGRLKIVFTQYSGHAKEIAEREIREGAHLIIAGGGDGTINEIGSVVVDTNIPIGILPLGSGNGLARHLKIKNNISQLVKSINGWRFHEVDVFSINDKLFFNVAGIGFDAFISKKFENKKQRGFLGYFVEILKEFNRYKEKRYEINIDGKVYREKSFFITFANSSQFGNEAKIAPFASINDGLVDVCIARKFPLFLIFYYGFLLRIGKINSSKKIKIIKGSHVLVNREEDGPVHVDGEPLTMGKQIELKLFPKKLQVLK